MPRATDPEQPASVATATPLPAASRAQRWLVALDRRRRAVLVANLVAQIGIIVTGGLVRLTGSGLGCSTWPQCEPGSFTPVYHPAATYHSAIEFGNRTLTFVLCVVAGLTAVTVWRQRDRATSYRVLGLVPIVGVVVQAVVGGITVLVDLHPAVVGSHMFISLALVAASTWLLVRHREGDGPARAVLASPVRALAAVSGVLAVPMLVLGVVTTGAGPHSGDEEVGYRFALDPAHAAKLHGMSVWLYFASVVVLAVVVVRASRRGPGAPAPRRALGYVGAVITLQAVIGYAQYLTDLPVTLVLLHMLGAALATAAATNLVLSTRTRD